jgi:phosphonatase-like hydrolase
MKVSMVIFDMAGTTIDENNLVYKTLQKAIQSAGIKVSLEDVFEYGAGKEKLNAIQDIVGFFGTQDQEKLTTQIYTDFLMLLEKAYEETDIKGIDNAEEVLQSLRNQNILVVLNTGYNKKTATQLLDKIKWRQFFHYDLLVTADDVKQSRPAPDMIQYAMNLCAIDDPKKIIKVGDSAIDIEEGNNANCLYSIGVTTGAHTAAQLKKANPSYIFEDISEVLSLVNKLN